MEPLPEYEVETHLAPLESVNYHDGLIDVVLEAGGTNVCWRVSLDEFRAIYQDVEKLVKEE